MYIVEGNLPWEEKNNRVSAIIELKDTEENIYYLDEIHIIL